MDKRWEVCQGFGEESANLDHTDHRLLRRSKRSKFSICRPTSRPPLSGLLSHGHALPLLQLATEVTGTHLLGCILGGLPVCVRGVVRLKTRSCFFFKYFISATVEDGALKCLVLKQGTDLYLIFVWPRRSLLDYCLDNALRSPSPLPLPPLAGSNVGLAAVVIFTGSKMI